MVENQDKEIKSISTSPPKKSKSMHSKIFLKIKIFRFNQNGEKLNLQNFLITHHKQIQKVIFLEFIQTGNKHLKKFQTFTAPSSH